MSIIIPANSAAGGAGYQVDNSCRFNSGSSDSLSRSSTAGNKKTWTFSFWLKRSKLDVLQFIAFSDVANYFRMRITSGNVFEIFDSNGNNTWNWGNLLRDTSAWYHLVLRADSTDGTNGNRLRLYINGTLASANTVASISQGYDFSFNQGGTFKIAEFSGNNYLDGYLAETILIDGQALAPTDFGEFDEDSGIWKPIDVSGLTFGSQGFYLDYKDSGALGNDVSGNNKDFTANNLTAIDQTTDTPTNNFCTPNPLYPPSNGSVVFSEGNLKTVFSTYSQSPNGTMGAYSGKWYYEMKMADTHARFGWCESHCPQGDTDSDSTFPAYAIYSNGSNGLSVYKNVTARGITNNTGYTSWSAGNTVGIAFDIDNGKFYAHLNGTYYNSGNPASGSGALITGITAQEGGLFIPYLNCGTSSSKTFEWNFGSPPYAISSGNTDGNDRGDFEYEVPSGYLALCTKNISEASS
mgnify:FL=1